MLNDIFTELTIIMDIFEKDANIDETQVLMQIVVSAYKSVINSLTKLEVQAEQYVS